jgi:exodeoxyribonuclease-5
MELSKDQKSCFDILMDWVNSKQMFMSMGGYAGTGKTTLLGHLRNKIAKSKKIAFICYTGKAASVLRSKLRKVGIDRYPNDYCGTIHSLIYEPKLDKFGEIEGWKLKIPSEVRYDYIIIDEASMVNLDIFNDLKSYNIPILAVGDHGQLPPIEGTFNLMSDPFIKLEKVHRFAENDALIMVSILAREQGYIPHGTYGDAVHKVAANHSMISQFIKESGDFQNSAILCGFNKTRIGINRSVRQSLGYSGDIPKIGERIICLKNNKNAKQCPVYNGVQATVQSCSNHSKYLDLFAKVDGELLSYKGKASTKIFNCEKPFMDDFIMDNITRKTTVADLMAKFEDKEPKVKRQRVYLDCFDFGYALTVHKSQGSEWDNVMVIEQPCQYWEGRNWNRWLYTAVTRSKGRLLIVK